MKLHYLVAALLACVCAAPVNAANLDDFGLAGVESCSDAEAATVRGQGAISTGMASFQIMVFDYVSGSSFNFQGSSINLSDEVSFGPEAFRCCDDSGTPPSDVNRIGPIQWRLQSLA